MIKNTVNINNYLFGLLLIMIFNLNRINSSMAINGINPEWSNLLIIICSSAIIILSSKKCKETGLIIIVLLINLLIYIGANRLIIKNILNSDHHEYIIVILVIILIIISSVSCYMVAIMQYKINRINKLRNTKIATLLIIIIFIIQPISIVLYLSWNNAFSNELVEKVINESINFKNPQICNKINKVYLPNKLQNDSNRYYDNVFNNKLIAKNICILVTNAYLNQNARLCIKNKTKQLLVKNNIRNINDALEYNINKNDDLIETYECLKYFKERDPDRQREIDEIMNETIKINSGNNRDAGKLVGN